MSQQQQMAAAMQAMQVKMRSIDYGIQLAPIKKRILEKDFTCVLEYQPADFLSAMMSVICDLQKQVEAKTQQ